MSFETCIRNAVATGNLDQRRADMAIERVRDLEQRYIDSGMSPADARVMAGDDALESIVKDARSRRHTALRQMQQMQKSQARYSAIAKTDPDLIIRDVEHAQHEFEALQQSFMSSISEFLAEFRTDLVGRVRGKAMLKEVVEELHGAASGNPKAAALSKAVQHVQERARVLFNAQGGDIGKLADFGISHRHEANKIRAAGFQKWADDIFGRLDWNRIIDHTTAKPFTATPGGRPNRAQADRFLQDVFKGIISGGWDDRFPSFTEVARSTANSRAEHRTLHFKSGADWWDYNEDYGAANAFEAVVQQLSGMARDIALMRTFGPNPRAGLGHAAQVMQKVVDEATDLTGRPHVKRSERVQKKVAKARVMLDMLTGVGNRPSDPPMARFFAGTRNLLTAAQLGGASLSQVTDWGSMALAAKAIGLGARSTWTATVQSMLRGITPQQAKDMGYIFDTWFNAGASQARFMGSVWTPEVTSRITNTVMRANGMAFLTDRARFGVAMSFGSDLAQVAGKGFDDLDPALKRFMEGNGITAREWDAVRNPAAMFTDPTGGRHISGDWFRRHSGLPDHEAEDIAIKWGALVRAHQEMAIPTASLRGRATIVGDSKPGTIGGELLRSTVMYKSFMLSVLFNQLRRVQDIDGNMNRALYVAKYIAIMTVLGSVAVQLKEVAKGRDPRPMDDPKFWGASLLQGGGLGIFGDFFSATSSRAGGGLAETAGGPVVGLIGDIGRAVSSNAQRVAEGKDPLIGRDFVNIVSRYNPLATYQPPVPIPIRAAMGRMVWDPLQLILDPEARELWNRQARQQKKDYSNANWWRRGSFTPDRSPDLGNIGGGQ